MFLSAFWIFFKEKKREREGERGRQCSVFGFYGGLWILWVAFTFCFSLSLTLTSAKEVVDVV